MVDRAGPRGIVAVTTGVQGRTQTVRPQVREPQAERLEAVQTAEEFVAGLYRELGRYVHIHVRRGTS